MLSFPQLSPCFPSRAPCTRSGAIGLGCPIGSACGPCWSAWSPGAAGSTPSAWSGGVSDTTLRTRRDEWSAAGVFERLAEMMLSAYNETIGLRCEELSVDGSIHKAPCGGEGDGQKPS